MVREPRSCQRKELSQSFAEKSREWVNVSWSEPSLTTKETVPGVIRRIPTGAAFPAGFSAAVLATNTALQEKRL